MARTRKHLLLVDIAIRNNGVIALDNPDVQKILANGTAYRLPSYIWDIKHYSQLEVTAVRQNRKIIAYELPAIKALAASAQTVVEPMRPTPSVETVSAEIVSAEIVQTETVEAVEASAV
jgi:hypothetical protein